jgi:hypothetical protein
LQLQRTPLDSGPRIIPFLNAYSLPGLAALSAFFTFGALASGLSCVALLLPGGSIDSVWRFNPQGHVGLLRLGAWGLVLMAVVSLACALAARGIWIRARWGRPLALGILAVNLVGDLTNALVRGDRRTLIGVPISGALIAYLMSARIKAGLASPKAERPGT